MTIKTAGIALLSLLLWAGPATATHPKADEYKSKDCSGDLNYGHASIYLEHVTMDDSTHCVYLAQSDWKIRTWQAYSEKTSNGGFCYGEVMGNLGPEKNNLDTVLGKRVKCLLNCATNSGAERSDKCRPVGAYIPKDKAADRGSSW